LVNCGVIVHRVILDVPFVLLRCTRFLCLAFEPKLRAKTNYPDRTSQNSAQKWVFFGNFLGVFEHFFTLLGKSAEAHLSLEADMRDVTELFLRGALIRQEPTQNPDNGKEINNGS
jgi:hypothetical protein